MKATNTILSQPSSPSSPHKGNYLILLYQAQFDCWEESFRSLHNDFYNLSKYHLYFFSVSWMFFKAHIFINYKRLNCPCLMSHHSNTETFEHFHTNFEKQIQLGIKIKAKFWKWRKQSLLWEVQKKKKKCFISWKWSRHPENLKETWQQCKQIQKAWVQENFTKCLRHSSPEVNKLQYFIIQRLDRKEEVLMKNSGF